MTTPHPHPSQLWQSEPLISGSATRTADKKIRALLLQRLMMNSMVRDRKLDYTPDQEAGSAFAHLAQHLRGISSLSYLSNCIQLIRSFTYFSASQSWGNFPHAPYLSYLSMDPKTLTLSNIWGFFQTYF